MATLEAFVFILDCTYRSVAILTNRSKNNFEKPSSRVVVFVSMNEAFLSGRAIANSF